MKRVTIQDVARAAGVGKVTVSYVLNGQSHQARIKPETAERIRRAAADLNYRPNAVARMLATQETQTLAVVFQYGTYFSDWSRFTGEVMRGVCAAAVDLGYDLMLHTKNGGDATREAESLLDGRADGALVLRDEDDLTMRELARRGFPTVQFFMHSENPTAASVDVDNVYGGRLATEHLLDLGHRRIAMIRGGLGSVASMDRYRGFGMAMQAGGFAVPDEFVLTQTGSQVDSAEIAALMGRAERPTAFFVWSDDTAIWLMESLKTQGFRVPEDVSVVGFDSLDDCERCSPPLTSVCQPVRQMAYAATEMLARLIRKESVPQSQVLFPLSLDVRGSTAPCNDHKEVNE